VHETHETCQICILAMCTKHKIHSNIYLADWTNETDDQWGGVSLVCNESSVIFSLENGNLPDHERE